jgi:DNA-binding transcriptional LysR family regulator
MNVDWDDLKIFLQLSRTRQMTAAAKALGMDDSTVSRRIARLESQLGVPLVLRAGRRTVITERGRDLAKAASELESIILRKVVGAPSDTVELAGVVRIGAPEGLGIGYLAESLGRLTTEHRNIEIELVALPRSYSLAAREVDIAITLDRPKSGQLTSQKLTDYKLGLYGSIQYFKKFGRPRDASELSSHTFTGYIPELLFTQELDFLKIAPAVQIKPAMRSTSVVAQVNSVASGAALGILPMFLAKREHRLHQIMTEDVVFERAYWLSVHDDLKARPLIKFAIETMRKDIKADRDLFLKPHVNAL